ncbi:methylated-DNA--[protein]-cysteine S-methyltransferase [Fructilactobacillus sp. Tb1]|uniref:methylated-DNA--[protein]-cysteine S-methyltransferase n=1 Tax=Fructilactobacillus sp. Tb1 TaxID=3422304 RepID=UPI003D2C2A9C
MLTKNYYDSPLGKITLLSNAKNLLGLWFNDQKFYGGKYDLKKVEVGTTPIIEQAKKWLDDYFAGKEPDPLKIPVDTQVTDFRKRVLEVLRHVPYGKTITYKDVADQINQPTASRAIGGAVGHNPISLIIPCHRIVGSNNDLTGYAGGVPRKLKLLHVEHVDTSKFKY